MGFLLVFARVGAWVWLTPPFGGGFLPPLVRVMAGLAFAVPMTPAAIAVSGGISLEPVDLLLQFALQIVIGVALGLVCLILLSAVQSAGALIDVASGFSLAAAYDPMMQQQSAVISKAYQLIAGVLILVSGAYLILFAGFAKTFEVLPIGNGLSTAATASTLTEALSVFFVAVLQIAGPIVAVLIVYGIGQVLESFLLTPFLVGERIGLHPLAVIFALMAFGQLFGFFGVLAALPASAALLVGLREVRALYLASRFYQGNS